MTLVTQSSSQARCYLLYLTPFASISSTNNAVNHLPFYIGCLFIRTISISKVILMVTFRTHHRMTTLVAIAATIFATIRLGAARVPEVREIRRGSSLAAINSFSRYQGGLQNHGSPYSQPGLLMCTKLDETHKDVHDNCNDIVILSGTVLKFRGGGGTGSALFNFPEYIAASKSRSWTILLLSILTDAVSTTLMKTAQEESSTPKLVLAFCGYLIR
jgi:hypothetical protein